MSHHTALNLILLNITVALHKSHITKGILYTVRVCDADTGREQFLHHAVLITSSVGMGSETGRWGLVAGRPVDPMVVFTMIQVASMGKKHIKLNVCHVSHLGFS